MRFLLAIVVGAIIAGVCVPAIGLVNPGFEESILEDGIEVPLFWDRENYVSVVSSFGPEEATTGSTENWLITSEHPLLPFQGGSFVVLSNGDIDEYESSYGKISQTVEFQAGQKLSGVFFFGTCDYDPSVNNDFATISLMAAEGSGLADIEVVRMDVETVGDYGSNSGWIYFESDIFTEANAGLYTLEIGVFDDGDNKFNSYFMVDALYIPEPATLMLLGLGGLITFRRRK